MQQMSRRIRDLNDKLVFKLAAAEFGNRLARSTFISASTEFTTSRDGHEAVEKR